MPTAGATIPDSCWSMPWMPAQLGAAIFTRTRCTGLVPLKTGSGSVWEVAAIDSLTGCPRRLLSRVIVTIRPGHGYAPCMA